MLSFVPTRLSNYVPPLHRITEETRLDKPRELLHLMDSEVLACRKHPEQQIGRKSYRTS
jgi:hypothetical protein